MLQGYVPYIIIGVVAALLIAATVVAARLAWRKQVRRYIVGLVGRAEDIRAGLKALDSVVGGLISGGVEGLLAFAGSDSDERHAVAEIASRMRIASNELAEQPLPKRLWPLADRLGEAAGTLAETASRVGEAEGEAVLDALAELDLRPVRDALAASEEHVAVLAKEYELTDSAVYGGGLYI